jgi:hypothetical protein
MKKRFIFWDDFRPVEYANDDCVPVQLFLSLFIGQSTEIQAIVRLFLLSASALPWDIYAALVPLLCLSTGG